MQDYSTNPHDMERENLGLRTKLKNLLQDARKNESTLRRFQTLELRLLASNSLTDLVRMLLHHGCSVFGWDEVSLVLYDKDHEIRHMHEQIGENSADYSQLIFIQDLELLKNLYGTEKSPILTRYVKKQHSPLFPMGTKLASVALLPLVRKNRLLGSLNLGSLDSNRFQHHSATDFLEHLAAVLTTCIYTTVAQERLKQTGLTDALTGVNNRRFFDQRLQEEVDRTRRINAPLSCLFIDIDHFKQINDTYGHQAGDSILKGVAGLIRSHLRSSMDVVARYGGEEFAILLGQTGKDKALEVAERIRLSVAEHKFTGIKIPAGETTVSIGVATLKQEDMPRNAGAVLVSIADQAMYQAKQKGRNQVIYLSTENGKHQTQPA